MKLLCAIKMALHDSACQLKVRQLLLFFHRFLVSSFLSLILARSQKRLPSCWLWRPDRSKLVSHPMSQALAKYRLCWHSWQQNKKSKNCALKVFKMLIISVINHLFLHPFPEAFYRIQIGAVGRQKVQGDFRGRQVLLDCLIPVVRCIMITNGLVGNEKRFGDFLRWPIFVVEQDCLDSIAHPTIALLSVLRLELRSFGISQKMHAAIMPSSAFFDIQILHWRWVYRLHARVFLLGRWFNRSAHST